MRKEFTDLPPLVQVTANTHIALLEAALPGRLEAYYVTGSAALGDFVAGKSDTDFAAVLAGRISPGDVEALGRVYRAVSAGRMLAPLDGRFLPSGGLARGGAGLPCHRFNAGKYLGPELFRTSSPDGWMLKKYGVPALPGGPEGLPFEVDWGALLDGMKENLNTYWRKWAEDCRKPWRLKAAGLLARPAATEWAVLGISRLYYTFRERDVVSKAGAGAYALGALPERWHGIIREALRIRGGEPLRVPAVRRRNGALDFLEYMIRECNRIYPT